MLRAVPSFLAASGLAACGPVANDESALLLTMQAADSALVVEVLVVELVDLDQNKKTEVYEHEALGDFPRDPATHTVLIVAETPDRGERATDIHIIACDEALLVCPSTTTPNVVAEGRLSVTFVGGEQLDDETVTLE